MATSLELRRGSKGGGEGALPVDRMAIRPVAQGLWPLHDSLIIPDEAK